MRVATLTTWNENGVGLYVVTGLKPGGWIPAFAGMTDSGNTLAIFVAMTGTVISPEGS